MIWAQRISGTLRRVPPFVIYVVGFVPALLYLYWGVTGQFGADPVKAMEHALGLDALRFFIASLMITPLMRYLKLNLTCFRRALGLMAFYYICLHFAVYVFLDLQLDWAALAKDLTKRPYIIVGTLSLLLLIPVAVTSNDLAIRKLGSATWCRVHKLVYPAVSLAGVHYLWQAKAVSVEIAVYGVIICTLLFMRMHFWWAKRRRTAAISGLSG